MMEDPIEGEVEALRDLPQVLERQIAGTELIIEENAGDYTVRQRLDALGRRVVEGP